MYFWLLRYLSGFTGLPSYASDPRNTYIWHLLNSALALERIWSCKWITIIIRIPVYLHVESYFCMGLISGEKSTYNALKTVDGLPSRVRKRHNDSPKSDDQRSRALFNVRCSPGDLNRLLDRRFAVCYCVILRFTFESIYRVINDKLPSRKAGLVTGLQHESLEPFVTVLCADSNCRKDKCIDRQRDSV